MNPTHRPAVLTAAISAHVAFGLLFAFAFLFDTGIVTALPMIAAFTVAATLHLRPGKNSRIGATILSILWAMSIVCAPISAAILYALWNRTSTEYFAAADRARLPLSVPYGTI